jgi:hypothetical protein
LSLFNNDETEDDAKPKEPELTPEQVEVGEFLAILNEDQSVWTTERQALAEYKKALDAGVPAEEAGPKPVFKLDTEAKLLWFLRKVNGMRREKLQIQANADAMISALDRDVFNLENRFGQQACGMAAKKLAEETGKQTGDVRYLTGTVSIRQQHGMDRVEIPNNNQSLKAGLVKFVKENLPDKPELIRETTTEDVLPSVLKPFLSFDAVRLLDDQGVLLSTRERVILPQPGKDPIEFYGAIIKPNTTFEIKAGADPTKAKTKNKRAA